MASNLLLGFLIYFVGINLAAFFLYGQDKHKAKRHQWRVPEHTLLLAAFLGGCIGAMAGMALFRHKTRKTKFRVGVPAAVVLWADIGFLGVPFCLLALGLRRSGKVWKNLRNR